MIGSSGQLGTDLMEAFGTDRSFEAVGLTHADIEVSGCKAESRLIELKPAVVVNTAAFHRTEACEDDAPRAFAVNSLGAFHVAKASRALEAVNIYQSTDYVFSGGKGVSYSEEDEADPINVYGASKLAGEKITAGYSTKYYVVRSSSLFGVAGSSGKGGNFVESILKQARAGAEIRVVNDITMSPTYTKDLAAAIVEMIKRKPPYGVYHVTNSGSCTWWQFASDIVRLAGLEVEVKKSSSADRISKVRRPSISALSNSKLAGFGIKMRDYKDALRDYLVAKGHLPKTNR